MRQPRETTSREPTLTLAQQVRLSNDYSTAQDVFDQWLHFVTDTIAAQSSLEAVPLAAPEFCQPPLVAVAVFTLALEGLVYLIVRTPANTSVVRAMANTGRGLRASSNVWPKSLHHLDGPIASSQSHKMVRGTSTPPTNP
jgi:hypothetical protein